MVVNTVLLEDRQSGKWKVNFRQLVPIIFDEDMNWVSLGYAMIPETRRPTQKQDYTWEYVGRNRFNGPVTVIKAKFVLFVTGPDDIEVVYRHPDYERVLRGKLS